MVTYNYDGSVKKVVSGGSITATVNASSELLYLKIQKELLISTSNQEALADSQKLIESEPLWATPHVLAALAYINLGNLDAAKIEFKKAKDLVPPGYEYEQEYAQHFQHLEEAFKRHEPRP